MKYSIFSSNYNLNESVRKTADYLICAISLKKNGANDARLQKINCSTVDLSYVTSDDSEK